MLLLFLRICGDLTSVFRPYHSEKIQTPDFLARNAFVESIHKAKFKDLPSYKLLNRSEITAINHDPANSPYMPKQETGIKPSCALPYELHVDGKLSTDKKIFKINFTAGNKVFGDKSIGAPFNVYAPGKYVKAAEPQQFEEVRTWSYGLTAGDSLADIWPLKPFLK